jgi:hypothetical protein
MKKCGRFIQGREPKLQLIVPTPAKGFWSRLLQLFQRMKFRVLEDIVFETSAGERIVVPLGFVSDLASLPLWLPLWMMTTTIQPGAIVHDFLCVNKDRPRRERDWVFWDAMTTLQAFYLLRIVYWASVRIYGLITLQG